jgi:hypothetical protein
MQLIADFFRSSIFLAYKLQGIVVAIAVASGLDCADRVVHGSALAGIGCRLPSSSSSALRWSCRTNCSSSEPTVLYASFDDPGVGQADLRARFIGYV